MPTLEVSAALFFLSGCEYFHIRQKIGPSDICEKLGCDAVHQARHRTTSTDNLIPPYSPPNKKTSISTHRQTSTLLSKCHYRKIKKVKNQAKLSNHQDKQRDSINLGSRVAVSAPNILASLTSIYVKKISVKTKKCPLHSTKQISPQLITKQVILKSTRSCIVLPITSSLG